MPYKHISKEELASLGAWYKNIFAPEALMPAIVIAFLSMAQILYTIYMEPYARSYDISNVGLFFTVYALALLATRPCVEGLLINWEYQRCLCPERLFLPCPF